MNLAQEAIAAKKKYTEILHKIGKDVFIELAKPVFEKHPEVTAIRWKQYTPGFNDGDPCTFCVCESEIQLKEDGSFFGEYSEPDEEDENFQIPDEINETMADFDKSLRELEDACELVFDSNQEITIYRDGKIEQDWYDCGY